ncbi:type II toxin-antitoxin system PemK/MazF family toxin [Fusobacterium nucleatum]|uniref:type II toxin-antitoxin system PemK/MazF family toxin n=1 Tax=Fusobacterium nucleatum TaxID=851 RepID=UPI0025F590DC|nr:type II toxin-antitoxin system PemK/MazF family toxin [uncultured Fusobacterium sp.]
MKKFNRIFKRLLKQFKKLISADEYTRLLKYIIILISKNKKIIVNKNRNSSPVIACKRGEIFLVNFGFGIGSEFRYTHYCVVIAVDRNDVIVVPFTSKINNSNLTVNLGVINSIQDLNDPLPKTSYALVKAIRSIDRTRLMRPRNNGQMIYPKLTANQLTLIDNIIKKYLIY